MFYLENKNLPIDYAIELIIDSIKRELKGKDIDLSDYQTDFLRYLLSYPSKSEYNTAQCVDLIKIILTLQRVQ